MANEVFALLPTPSASDGEKEGQRYGKGDLKLSGALRLLPTPLAEVKGPSSKRGANAQGSPSLDQTVKLLPTPHGMAKEGQKRRPGPSGNELGVAIRAAVSGLTGETLDPPSDAGKVSTDLRLSPWFVEWMMGMPEGWSDPGCLLSATEFNARSGFSPAATSSSSSGSQ
ncbi:MAG TPA: hypothetical protein VMS11_01805 [Solirubrobacterales bacterium]|nr:hypothetical protein [Solirubrobacterales bacterium]